MTENKTTKPEMDSKTTAGRTPWFEIPFGEFDLERFIDASYQYYRRLIGEGYSDPLEFFYFAESPFEHTEGHLVSGCSFADGCITMFEISEDEIADHISDTKSVFIPWTEPYPEGEFPDHRLDCLDGKGYQPQKDEEDWFTSMAIFGFCVLRKGNILHFYPASIHQNSFRPEILCDISAWTPLHERMKAHLEQFIVKELEDKT